MTDAIPRAAAASAAQIFSQPPSFPPAPSVNYPDSAKYWNAVAAPSAASKPAPAQGFYRSPVPQSPSWESVPTQPADHEVQLLSQPPSPRSWGTSAPFFDAQRNSIEAPTTRATAPTEHPVAEKQFVPPKSAPLQDFAQADPFGGFAKPSAGESLANQAQFNECEASQTGTLVPMKGGNYQFCTYGRPALTKQDPDTGHPTGFLVTPGPNGNEVYGRDRITGAWNRWTLAPGQSLIATIDEDGNFHMEIR